MSDVTILNKNLYTHKFGFINKLLDLDGDVIKDLFKVGTKLYFDEGLIKPESDKLSQNAILIGIIKYSFDRCCNFITVTINEFFKIEIKSKKELHEKLCQLKEKDFSRFCIILDLFKKIKKRFKKESNMYIKYHSFSTIPYEDDKMTINYSYGLCDLNKRLNTKDLTDGKFRSIYLHKPRQVFESIKFTEGGKKSYDSIYGFIDSNDTEYFCDNYLEPLHAVSVIDFIHSKIPEGLKIKKFISKDYYWFKKIVPELINHNDIACIKVKKDLPVIGNIKIADVIVKDKKNKDKVLITMKLPSYLFSSSRSVFYLAINSIENHYLSEGTYFFMHDGLFNCYTKYAQSWKPYYLKKGASYEWFKDNVEKYNYGQRRLWSVINIDGLDEKELNRLYQDKLDRCIRGNFGCRNGCVNECLVDEMNNRSKINYDHLLELKNVYKICKQFKEENKVKTKK